jgi:hypothetical protein
MAAQNQLFILRVGVSLRTTLVRILLVVASVPLLAACGPAVPEISQQDLERARAALEPFKQQLMEALVTALEEGPENAIKVCRLRAPEIASELSTAEVRMGRTSHRLRNPQNSPEPWMEPLLASYLEDSAKVEAQAVRLPGGTFGYVEPIRVRHFCLSCHGPSLDPSLENVIRELYPDDQATGFRAGGFRGLFWVIMPLGEAEETEASS